jgi:hypothetical protein
MSPGIGMANPAKTTETTAQMLQPLTWLPVALPLWGQIGLLAIPLRAIPAT